MIEDMIVELTKMLIKQTIKDKEEGIEYIKIPKANIIKENIKLLKMLK